MVLTRSVHGLEVVPTLNPDFHAVVELAETHILRINHELGTAINTPLVDNEVVFKPFESKRDGFMTEPEIFLNGTFGSLHATVVSLPASKIHEDFEHRRGRRFSD